MGSASLAGWAPISGKAGPAPKDLREALRRSLEAPWERCGSAATRRCNSSRASNGPDGFGGKRDGFSGTAVRAVVKASDGAIWFGTDPPPRVPPGPPHVGARSYGRKF